MYVPPHFREGDAAVLHTAIRAARLCSLVTGGDAGLVATPLPMLLTPDEGPFGTLYGHIARANPQRSASGQALAIFMGPDAYVSPGWYPSKRETGKVVPTWNYVAVHAYGPLEIYDDPDRLLAHVTRLTDAREAGRAQPWSVDDAPEAFVRSQLRGIVGLRLPITRLEGKRKLSQNQPAANRRGVAAGLEGGDAADLAVARLIPLD